ncbi:MAG: hypothetical protein EON60_07320 [Alphaproteobacteria bacterium]|nr:MAG: hypothetical protein EON60_07320 [Alphaproteobacteria bacterium]
MKRRLRIPAFAFATVAAMVAGVTVTGTVVAEGSPKGTRAATAPTNEGTTTQGHGVQHHPESHAFGTPSNDNIAPAAGTVTSTAPSSRNTYETNGSKLRDDVRNSR